MSDASPQRRDSATRSSAFTLVELLVVIAIIAVLAGLLMMASSVYTRIAKRQRTQVVMETIRQALEVTRATQGSAASPVEHPLAGSYAEPGKPRAKFRRSDGTTLATSVSIMPGTVGEDIALSGVKLTNLAIAQNRLMLPDDYCSDVNVPLLYGLKREDVGVLGASLANVTRYRRLTKQPTPTAIIPNPDDLTVFPDEKCLVSSVASASANKTILDYVFGGSDAGAELARLGALYAPPDDLPANLIAYGRVWSAPGQALPADRGSRINEGGTWKRYRLRGVAVYDAWEREILYAIHDDGVIRLSSAGPDGCFRWLPGPDKLLTTDPWATAPAGDDLDASKDNISLVVGAK